MSHTVTTTTKSLSWDDITGPVEWIGDPFKGSRSIGLHYNDAFYKSSETSPGAQYIVAKLMLRGFDHGDVHLQHIHRVTDGVPRETIKMEQIDAYNDCRWTLTLVKQE